MCCSFNIKSADEIFKDRMYSDLVQGLQDHDKALAFGSTTLPDWFVSANEPKSQGRL
jgi:hypothetical protein